MSRMLKALLLSSPLWAAHGDPSEVHILGQMPGRWPNGYKYTEWPEATSDEIELKWLIDSEWAGKSAKYILADRNILRTDLMQCHEKGCPKACQITYNCKWAANAGQVYINTGVLGFLTFKVDGLDKVDVAKLEARDEDEFKKLTLVTESGAKLSFNGMPREPMHTDPAYTKNFFKVLDVEQNATIDVIKAQHKALTASAKGKDKKKLAEIEMAFSILGDADKRLLYTQGGYGAVKRSAEHRKQLEDDKVKEQKKLDKIEEMNPQKPLMEDMFEKKYSDQAITRVALERARDAPEEVFVDLTAQELDDGVKGKIFEFKRKVLCHGCYGGKSDSRCNQCGECPETRDMDWIIEVDDQLQIIARQGYWVLVRSNERCSEETVTIHYNVPIGTNDGDTLYTMMQGAHDRPSFLRGNLVLKARAPKGHDVVDEL